MRTSSPPPAEPRWFLVDAKEKTLGRLATRIAHVLRGKHKPTFAPNTLHGDHVIVTNAGEIILEGRKAKEKVYRRHSGFFGNLRTTTAASLRREKPLELLTRAVRGMLPRNRLRKRTMTFLHPYQTSEHPHGAQRPLPLDSVFLAPPLDPARGKLRPSEEVPPPKAP